MTLVSRLFYPFQLASQPINFLKGPPKINVRGVAHILHLNRKNINVYFSKDLNNARLLSRIYKTSWPPVRGDKIVWSGSFLGSVWVLKLDGLSFTPLYLVDTVLS